MKPWKKYTWTGSIFFKEDTRRVEVNRIGEKLYEVKIALKKGGFTIEKFSRVNVVEKFQRFILPAGSWVLIMPQSFYRVFPELRVKPIKSTRKLQERI